MKVYAAVIHIMIAFWALSTGPVYAKEPEMPNIDMVFSLEKEQRISQLESLSSQAVFNAFNSPEFFEEEEYLNKAIFRAFNFRTDEAIRLALGYVRSVQVGRGTEGARNLYIAKRVFQIFPDEALDDLLDIYDGGGPKVKANVIYALGQMAGGETVKVLLVEALDETNYCQDVTSETLGEPLRVCDTAYNQLVLRYKVKNVLRTIGTSHSIDVRDYYVALIRHQI